MKFIDKIIDLFTMDRSEEKYVPTFDLSSEKEEEIIEKIVHKVEQYGLKEVTLLFLRTYKPIGVYGSQVAPTLFGPYFMLLDLFDIEGFNYNAYFMKRENIDKLIKRIEKI